jgi:hypothetical protein
MRHAVIEKSYYRSLFGRRRRPVSDQDVKTFNTRLRWVFIAILIADLAMILADHSSLF